MLEDSAPLLDGDVAAMVETVVAEPTQLDADVEVAPTVVVNDSEEGNESASGGGGGKGDGGGEVKGLGKAAKAKAGAKGLGKDAKAKAGAKGLGKGAKAKAGAKAKGGKAGKGKSKGGKNGGGGVAAMLAAGGSPPAAATELPRAAEPLGGPALPPAEGLPQAELPAAEGFPQAELAPAEGLPQAEFPPAEGLPQAEGLPLTQKCCFCRETCSTYYVVSKKRGEFLCASCNTARRILYRGQQMDQVAMLGKDDTEEFFKSVKGKKTSEVLRLASSTVTKAITTDLNEDTEGGEFLPLSVWQTKGFDIAKIAAEAAPEDITEHKYLGPCYRVNIRSGYHKRTRGEAFEDIANVHSSSANEEAPKSAKQLKLMEKKMQSAKDAARRQVTRPVERMIESLEKLEGQLDVGKMLPGAGNPVKPVLDSLNTFVAESKTGEFVAEAAKKKSAELLDIAKRTVRSLAFFKKTPAAPAMAMSGA